MRLLTLGWLSLLAIFTLTISSCDDDDGGGNDPVVGTLFDNLEQESQFSTLVAALERTGLDATLDIPNRRFTLLAPTDAAFASAGIDLNAVSDDALQNILLYHVIPDIVRDNDFGSFFIDGTTNINSANTQGPGNANLPLQFGGNGTFTVNGNTTVTPTPAFAEAINGIAYAIDQVLMPPTIVDRAVLNGSFTTLVSALQRVGLDDVLAGEGTFTVFAPTDAAFAASGINLDDVSDDDLRQLLLYHVLGSNVRAGDIPADNSFATTLSTASPSDSLLSLLIDNQGDDGVVLNGSSNVVATNVFATNGVVHAIDAVLMMQDAVGFTVAADGTQRLEEAVIAAGLVETLQGDGPFTIFAPVNSAFESIDELLAGLSTDEVRDLLLNHVVAGNLRAGDLEGGTALTTVGGSQIQLDTTGGISVLNGGTVNFVTTNIQGTNAVIHLIDQVLYPFDVVDQAILTPETQSLEDALIAAGLIETLRNGGPFTIFAPTNDAFEGVDTDALTTDQLRNILLGHVVEGSFTAAMLPASGQLTALNGNPIRFNQELTLIIDDPDAPRTVEIVATDVEATNGIIHLIGGVLLGDN